MSSAGAPSVAATCDAQRCARLRALDDALRAVAAELVEPEIEIDAVAAEAAFGQHGGDVGGFLARAEAMRIHDHPRQPRRQRQLAQAVAFRGDPAVGIERAEFAEQAARLLQRRRRRRIEKRQRARDR